MDGGFVYTVVASLAAALWIIYLALYHARLMGSICTRLINRFYLKDGGYLGIGESIH